MPFQSNPKAINWQVHFKAPIEQVYDMIASNDGRAQFWAESAMELEKYILFVFPNGQTWRGKVLDNQENLLLRLNYLGNTTLTLLLDSDGSSGTVLTLTDEGVKAEERAERAASWVSVLMALKAAVDFRVDLRNHNEKYTLEKGFLEN